MLVETHVRSLDSMSQARKASGKNPSGRSPADSGSRLVRGQSNASSGTGGGSGSKGFNSKEVSEYLTAQVEAAKGSSAFVYQGEQRAWGGSRPFNPVKDDFLQLVEMALEAFKAQTS